MSRNTRAAASAFDSVKPIIDRAIKDDEIRHNVTRAWNAARRVYDDLDGVQDGGMAMEAFMEAIHPDTAADRKNQIEQQLLAYCKLDTYAMVRLWQVFAGRTDLKL